MFIILKLSQQWRIFKHTCSAFLRPGRFPDNFGKWDVAKPAGLRLSKSTTNNYKYWDGNASKSDECSLSLLWSVLNALNDQIDHINIKVSASLIRIPYGGANKKQLVTKLMATDILKNLVFDQENYWCFISSTLYSRLASELLNRWVECLVGVVLRSHLQLDVQFSNPSPTVSAGCRG